MNIHNIYTPNQVSKVLGNLSRITLPFWTVWFSFPIKHYTMQFSFYAINKRGKILILKWNYKKLSYDIMSVWSTSKLADFALNFKSLYSQWTNFFVSNCTWIWNCLIKTIDIWKHDFLIFIFQHEKSQMLAQLTSEYLYYIVQIIHVR